MDDSKCWKYKLLCCILVGYCNTALIECLAGVWFRHNQNSSAMSLITFYILYGLLRNFVWFNNTTSISATIPHLAAVLAMILGDNDLSRLTVGTVIDDDTFTNPLDRQAYNELVNRLSKAEVVRKLKARRTKQSSNLGNRLKHIAAVIVKDGNDIFKLRTRTFMSITFEGDDENIFETLTAKFGTELLRKLQDARKQWNDSVMKEMHDLSRLAAVIVNGGNDIFKLGTRALRSIPFEGDVENIFKTLTAKFGTNELLKKLKDAREKWNNSETKIALEESNNLKRLAAALPDQCDISTLTTLTGISFEGRANESIKSLRSKYNDGELLEKLQEVNRRKEEETWKFEFDTSEDKTLGFFLGESETKDELLVTDIDSEGRGKNAGLKDGTVIKSINGDEWRGKGDYDRMIERMIQAIEGEKVV